MNFLGTHLRISHKKSALCLTLVWGVPMGVTNNDLESSYFWKVTINGYTWPLIARKSQIRPFFTVCIQYLEKTPFSFLSHLFKIKRALGSTSFPGFQYWKIYIYPWRRLPSDKVIRQIYAFTKDPVSAKRTHGNGSSLYKISCMCKVR